MKKKIPAFLLCFIMGVGSLFPAHDIQADDKAIRIQNEKIAPGVEQALYQWNTSQGQIIFSVLKCDLTNPNLDLRVIAGKGTYTKRATVTQMASQTGAVAAINGDYFNTALQGAPLGPSVVNGQLRSSSANLLGIFALGIDTNNTAYIEKMGFEGKIVAPSGETFPIDGLNKTVYWYEPSHQESHSGTIQVYDDFWTSASRGHSTNSEALLDANGKIEKISLGKTLAMAVPQGKKIIQFSGKAKDFITANFSEGDTMTLDYALTPARNWKLVLGGHAMLVDGGQVVPYTRSLSAVGGVRARSAVGITKDGKTLFIVAAEGRTNRSVGSSLSTLSWFFVQLGVDKALNLDGGGSTALISKRLGEEGLHQEIVPERYANERPVVNGLGVYNSLPKTNEVGGFELEGVSEMYLGETMDFGIKRAWDSNLHPLGKDIAVTFKKENALGSWYNNSFQAKKAGTLVIEATASNGITAKKTVKIKDFSDIVSVTTTLKTPLQLNQGLTVETIAYDKAKKAHKISPRVIEWSFEDLDAVYDTNTGKIIVKAFKGPWGVIKAKIGSKTSRITLENPNANLVKLLVNEPVYVKQGKRVPMDTAAIIKDGRTLVPLRFVVEEFKGEVNWNQKEKVVSATIKGHRFTLPISNTTIEVDGIQKKIDVPAAVIKNYTYVPVRFISETIGLKIGYDNVSNTVFISE